MAASEQGVPSGGTDSEQFSRKGPLDLVGVVARTIGISVGRGCGAVSVQTETNKDCDDKLVRVSSLCGEDPAEEEDGEGSISSMDSGRNNKRRTLRFDSSESSDSGVAALSGTDSSRSSGHSDITEPGSPPSPVSSPSSGVSSPSDLHDEHHHEDGHHRGDSHDHLHHHHLEDGYDPGSDPPSCQGSYDSGLDEGAAASLPPSDEGSLPPPEEEGSTEEDGATTATPLHVVVPEVPADGNLALPEQPERAASPAGAVLPDSGPHSTNAEPELLHLHCREPVTAACGSPSKNGAPLQQFFGPLPPVPFTSASLRPPPPVVSKATVDVQVCRWSECRRTLPGGGNMIEHIRGAHVDAQVNAESFVCLWEGCKVFNRASCSLSWLERHVLAHSGHKPFRCIVDGCGQRFTSQGGLERHVNSHFSGQSPTTVSALSSHGSSSSSLAGTSGAAPGGLHGAGTGGGAAGGHSGAGKRLGGRDDTPTKMNKKRRFKLRRASWTARKEDFFDAGIMECLRHRLITFNNHTKLGVEGSGSSMTFHSRVIARRIEVCGKVKVLLHWVPENVIPDEWVPESQVATRAKQTIPLASLPRDALVAVESLTVPASRPYRKNRRK